MAVSAMGRTQGQVLPPGNDCRIGGGMNVRVGGLKGFLITERNLGDQGNDQDTQNNERPFKELKKCFHR